MVWNTSSANLYSGSKTDYNKYNLEGKNRDIIAHL